MRGAAGSGERAGRRVGVAAVLAALLLAPAAAASDPSVLYTDFAEDRVLSCQYSRAELRAVLSDATLNQYGDPYTVIGLEAAVRKQLAGGCDRSPESAAGDDGSSGGERMLALGAGLLLALLGAGGWAARRAFTRAR